jgi:methylated-DNA-[protein]-cysteine S-methyltransferase
MMEAQCNLHTGRIASPIGELTIMATQQHLVAVLWPNENNSRVPWAHPASQRSLVRSMFGQRTHQRVERGSDALLPFRLQAQQGAAHALSNAIVTDTALQLHQYFAGTRKQFDLPLMFRGTAFQSEVWQTLRTIPYGQTWSYGELAKNIGKPKASRAVGAANGRNPLSIVVPCHRVVGSAGALTGFAGGIEAKRYLLDLENRQQLP